MKAMILAAGRGERMRPLTDKIPKPLLVVRGKPLIQYHIEALVQAGITQIVINHAWLGEKIEAALGNGSHLGAEINYSPEGDNVLETGGGIQRALPLLGENPFIVVNGDVWTDFSYTELPRQIDELAHLVLVNNLFHNLNGDFAFMDQFIKNEGDIKFTYTGIGVYSPALFSDCEPGRFPLAPLLIEAMNNNKITGEIYSGFWMDIGTPERLKHINDN